jgi:hypothetical protein
MKNEEKKKIRVYQIPRGSFIASMLRLGYALLVSVEVVLQSYFPLRYVTTAEFAAKPLLYKYISLLLSLSQLESKMSIFIDGRS